MRQRFLELVWDDGCDEAVDPVQLSVRIDAEPCWNMTFLASPRHHEGPQVYVEHYDRKLVVYVYDGIHEEPIYRHELLSDTHVPYCYPEEVDANSLQS